MSGPVDLPQYIKDGDFIGQQDYFQLNAKILTDWFNSNGFFQPSLTNAQVVLLLALSTPPPAGTHWFNTDLNKMQFMGNTNTVQTVTSV